MESTLVRMLRAQARDFPDAVAFRFLSDGKCTDERTFEELDRGARAVAAALQQRGATGERALLLYPPDLDFLVAFFGCIYAGVIAVPAYPPDPTRLSRSLPRLLGMVRDCSARLVLTTEALRDSDFIKNIDFGPGVELLGTGTTTSAGDWKEFDPEPEQDVFIQYTSGSTSDPKGVCLSHANLVSNVQVIHNAFEIQPDMTDAGSWLPVYHDMGLIGVVLSTLAWPNRRGSCYLMSPLEFLKRPLSWLQMISDYRISVSGAPNFGYELCARRITPEQRQGLDLSNWRRAFNGAEPIRQATFDRFVAAFGECGFRKEAFLPCYGLAEATLMVAGKGVREPVIDESTDRVSSGRLLTDVRIVDPETCEPLCDGEIGEIWVKGASVARGYWNRPEQTAQTFGARLTGTDEGPFLRTGDLAYLRDGELYVVGREKNMIVVRGRNLYAEDIERAVEKCHPGLRAGCAAAFALEADDEEHLALVQEFDPGRGTEAADAAAAVARRIVEEFGVSPRRVVLIAPRTIPKTSSGKLQRAECRRMLADGEFEILDQWPAAAGESVAAEAGAARTPTSKPSPEAMKLECWLIDWIGEHVDLPQTEIDPTLPFAELGLDSASSAALLGDLEDWLGRPLETSSIWDHPSPAQFARALTTSDVDESGGTVRVSDASDPNEPIAVVGVACRVPGAPDAEALWSLLSEGRDAVGEVPGDRWDPDALPDADELSAVRHGGFVENVDQFDAEFFSVSGVEAVRMDPQQRVLLETVWSALENAGMPAERVSGRAVGVFVGMSSSDYWLRHLRSKPSLATLDAYFGVGAAHSLAANRLSYWLDLRGPSLAVDTACSSSLVATHLACRSIRSGESEMAIVAGVNLLLSPELSMVFSRAKMLSPDGRCRTFDADANGYVRGEGCGVVVLKRLSDALRDEDPVAAVIRGTAVNQDGRSFGLTAPNGKAQQAVIREALADAGAAPADVQYVEAHGTGTPLGDPIEMKALATVYGEARDGEPCWVGSVKTNIGHLEAAAGVAGLIKTVLSLRHDAIPSHLNYRKRNPRISDDADFLRVPTEPTAWPDARPRMAGVSSFGFGGTNAHVVLEAAPPQEEAAARPVERPCHVLALSARSPEALRQVADRMRERVDALPDEQLADLCFSANTGRERFRHRAAIACASRSDLARALENFSARRPGAAIHSDEPAKKRPRVAFLFTGQGAQQPGLGRGLYESQPVFRAALDRCAAALDGHLEHPLLDFLDPESALSQNLDRTEFAQPTIFALEYALAELWRSWGVEPDVVLGHSLGEYVAACVAGVFELPDALRLVAKRARLMQETDAEGRMQNVCTDLDCVQSVLREVGDVEVAALNAEDRITISGPDRSVELATQRLEERGIPTKRLHVTQAFHSRLMDPILDDFEQLAQQVPAQPPRIPLVSNLTGKPFEHGQAPDAPYWRAHLRQPVRFAECLESVAEGGDTIFLEIGPRPVLSALGARALPSDDHHWLASLRPDGDAWETLVEAAAELHVLGVNLDWRRFDEPYARRRVSIPGYPFERRRYWMDEGNGKANGNGKVQAVVEEAAGAPVAAGTEVEQLMARQLQVLGDVVERQIRTLSRHRPASDHGSTRELSK